ncbi:hypothetical protein [Ileibacterium valens]|uniref:Uncharacterized protein n=1 Tax=Ileibacterium valens TaxID=1862668 RepID=A0A1U7NEZ6_9FIRM|nr:hypothetical protein [Ileibacterium valens]OLU38531.1 hypothetical protein BO222_08195 [Ileibacterium valens]OLU39124.1 hypothetical protein BO224_07910 [Erysipelotrichaceae bacterium NYU-BL-E8]OLU39487.1 hypothetical protein BM735_07320 [Erysipelotrichaceae bacterium NYU-BL-F16]
MLHIINSFYAKKRSKVQALLPVSFQSQTIDPIHEMTCQIREMLGRQDFVQCRELIIHLMAEYPDSAQPHNLMGLLLEEEGNHSKALSHFRAAAALDPSHRPSQENLHHFSQLYHPGQGVFEDQDCLEQTDTGHCIICYDKDGIGYVCHEMPRQKFTGSYQLSVGKK